VIHYAKFALEAANVLHAKAMPLLLIMYALATQALIIMKQLISANNATLFVSNAQEALMTHALCAKQAQELYHHLLIYANVTMAIIIMRPIHSANKAIHCALNVMEILIHNVKDVYQLQEFSLRTAIFAYARFNTITQVDIFVHIAHNYVTNALEWRLINALHAHQMF